LKRFTPPARLNSEKENFMSQNDLNSLFQQARKADFEPSPYMRTRILAQLRDDQKPAARIKIWKLFTAISLSALVLVSAYTLNLMSKIESNGVVTQAYVIHVNFNENDLAQVAKAEVVLPDDVNFVSKGLAQNKRSLKLPIDVKSVGRGKLPFVVTSKTDGEKLIRVRLLDENDNLIREQDLNFKFAKQDNIRTL
jgi:hypothetical protein